MSMVANQPDVALVRALELAERRFSNANPLSRARHERACRVLPGGHSRQTLYYKPFPVTIAHGRAARVIDLDGHEYLNLVSDFAAGVYGHGCQQIQRAVSETLQGGISLSGVNTKEVELAELISRRIPSMEQIRFCNSGSEACLYSAMLSLHHTGRAKLLVFNGCYHGGFMTYGPVDPPLSIPFDLVKATYNDVCGTRESLRRHGDSLAAVFVEPAMSAGGCIPATREFLSMLRNETRRLGILLVMDEVMTSRLAPGGLQGVHSLDPDITTLGKFWGGGFTFGAFGGSREIMRHFDVGAGGALSQFGTFNNNIVAMSAGLVGARDIYTADACIRLNAMGDRLREQLNALGRSRGIAFQATGVGASMSTHWQHGAIAHPGDIDASQWPLRRLFHLEMMLRGYYIAQRGMINLSLPMTEQDLAGFLEAVEEFLARHDDLLTHLGESR